MTCWYLVAERGLLVQTTITTILTEKRVFRSHYSQTRGTDYLRLTLTVTSANHTNIQKLKALYSTQSS